MCDLRRSFVIVTYLLYELLSADRIDRSMVSKFISLNVLELSVTEHLEHELVLRDVFWELTWSCQIQIHNRHSWAFVVHRCRLSSHQTSENKVEMFANMWGEFAYNAWRFQLLKATYMQDVASELMADHVRIHPALMSFSNMLDVLAKQLRNHQISMAALESKFISDAACKNMLLGKTFKQVWPEHLLAVEEAIVLLNSS